MLQAKSSFTEPALFSLLQALVAWRPGRPKVALARTATQELFGKSWSVIVRTVLASTALVRLDVHRNLKRRPPQ